MSNDNSNEKLAQGKMLGLSFINVANRCLLGASLCLVKECGSSA